MSINSHVNVHIYVYDNDIGKGTFSLKHIIYHDTQISRTSGVPMQREEGKLLSSDGNTFLNGRMSFQL